MEKFALIGANDTVATWDGNKLRWAKLKPGEIQATMDRAYQKALASNWLLACAPDAYLYGALLESAPYIKDDERIAVWTAGLVSVIDGLNGLNALASFNAGPLEMRTNARTP